MEKEYLEKLASIGLTEGEAKTYLALLSIGSSTVGPIVDMSGVSASKVYKILERLMQKGMVSMIIKEGEKQFTASEPEQILEYLDEEKKAIDEQKERIKEILPALKLKKDSAEIEPIAEVSYGKRGFEALYSEMIDTADEGETYFALGGITLSYRLQSIWYPYSVKLADKKISHRLIYEHTGWFEKDPKIHRRKERKLFYPMVLGEKYKNLPNLLVLGNKAILAGVDDKDEIFTLIIRNKHMTQVFMKLMDLISDLAYVPSGFPAFKANLNPEMK